MDPGHADKSGRHPRRGLVWLLSGTIVALSVVLILILSTPIADVVGGRVAGNIVPPDTREAAITAITPPVSVGEFTALSGRGEGLDCSIDALVEHAAFSGSGPSVNLRYRQACVAHDYCYRHGAVSYGYTQADCDAALARAALRVCRARRATARDCLIQVRKVYAGLAVGGASSYRPKRPDLLAVDEGPANEKEIKEACSNARHYDTAPKALTFAYPAWPKALKARFAPSWWPLSDRQEYQLALARCYDQLGPRGLERLFSAWMDLASTAGEYDPYPLGTADVSVPRSVRLDSAHASLVFYLQLPGGARLISYGWTPSPRNDVWIACAGGAGCVGTTLVARVPQSYDFRPATPLVAQLSDGRGGLLWWCRQLTGIDSTGGTLQLLAFDPKAGALSSSLGAPTDSCSSNLYPVPSNAKSLTMVALNLDCVVKAGRPPRVLTPPLVQVRKLTSSGGRLRSLSGVGSLRSFPAPLTWLGNPPFIENAMLTHRDRIGSIQIPGVGITAFRRAPADFRNAVESQSWFIPLDYKVRVPWMTAPLRLAHATFDVPEAAEPYAALRGSDGILRLLTVQCEPAQKVRCARDREGTRVTLWQSANREALKPLPLKYSYSRMRAALIRSANYARLPPVAKYILVLTRITLSRRGSNYVLDGYARRISVADEGLIDQGEKAFGKIADLPTAGEALLMASRLYPFVDDIDADGIPDLVLVDPARGGPRLAFLGALVRAGDLAIKTDRHLRTGTETRSTTHRRDPPTMKLR